MLEHPQPLAPGLSADARGRPRPEPVAQAGEDDLGVDPVQLGLEVGDPLQEVGESYAVDARQRRAQGAGRRGVAGQDGVLDLRGGRLEVTQRRQDVRVRTQVEQPRSDDTQQVAGARVRELTHPAGQLAHLGRVVVVEQHHPVGRGREGCKVGGELVEGGTGCVVGSSQHVAPPGEATGEPPGLFEVARQGAQVGVAPGGRRVGATRLDGPLRVVGRDHQPERSRGAERRPTPRGWGEAVLDQASYSTPLSVEPAQGRLFLGPCDLEGLASLVGGRPLRPDVGGVVGGRGGLDQVALGARGVLQPGGGRGPSREGSEPAATRQRVQHGVQLGDGTALAEGR